MFFLEIGKYAHFCMFVWYLWLTMHFCLHVILKVGLIKPSKPDVCVYFQAYHRGSSMSLRTYD